MPVKKYCFENLVRKNPFGGYISLGVTECKSQQLEMTKIVGLFCASLPYDVSIYFAVVVVDVSFQSFREKSHLVVIYY